MSIRQPWSIFSMMENIFLVIFVLYEPLEKKSTENKLILLKRWGDSKFKFNLQGGGVIYTYGG